MDWNPSAYSLHWQCISSTDLQLDSHEEGAAPDVSLVSGKVSFVLVL
jgi:hypothetical protein